MHSSILRTVSSLVSAECSMRTLVKMMYKTTVELDLQPGNDPLNCGKKFREPSMNLSESFFIFLLDQ